MYTHAILDNQILINVPYGQDSAMFKNQTLGAINSSDVFSKILDFGHTRGIYLFQVYLFFKHNYVQLFFIIYVFNIY